MTSSRMNRRKKVILFFVKFFSERKYARYFMEGKVHAKRLSYFKDIEGNDDSGRADRHEGVIGWFQPGHGRLTINQLDMTSDLAGPIEMQREWLNYRNVFCVYAAHSGDIDLNNLDSDNIEALRRQLQLSENCQKLGRFAVVIRSIPEFLRRIESAAEIKGYRISRGFVEYYDPGSFHGSFSDWEAIFRKQDKYMYQQEYRFVIDTLVVGDWPIDLEIGSIRDISLCFETSKFNQELLGGEIKVHLDFSTRYSAARCV